ncbi:MAG: L-fuculokinase [Marinilabiliaceae bacterium]
MKDLSIIFDCGATNVRVVAINSRGSIESLESFPNSTKEDPETPGGRIWDLDEIWDKFCKASKLVMSQIDTSRICGVSVTTFGADGAFLNEKDELMYPVVSWQCERTAPVMQNIGKYISLQDIYHETGVFPYNFNTVAKLIWFKENRPDIIPNDSRFLFMPSLIHLKLGGEGINDATMLGTGMITNIETRDCSEKVFQAIDVDPALFGPLTEPGENVGVVDPRASERTGLPENTPLIASGHDTQFAIVGSGAGVNQPVLSSGTWEILMCRSRDCTCTNRELDLGITTELDAEPGMYDIGINYMGSGTLEWIKRHFFPFDDYETMVREAEAVPPGSDGVRVKTDFYNAKDTGPAGGIEGLTLQTTRGHIFRAALEGLSLKMKDALRAVEKAGRFQASSVICVGGGSKNDLWNRIRADVCGVPVTTIDQKETTVLGAAMFVFKGTGVVESLDEARGNIDYSPVVYHPSGDFV